LFHASSTAAIACSAADPRPAEVTIRVHEDSDSTTYSLEVQLADGAWPIGAVGDKALPLHEKDVPHASQVWRDPKSGAPVGVAINGMAVLGMGTHRVEIRPDTSITRHGDSLDLHRGAVGSSGSEIVVGDTGVSALEAGDDSWFVVSDKDGQVLVAAYRGEAIIRDRDRRRTVVPAGSFAMAAAAPQSTQRPADNTARGGQTRGAQRAATRGKWSLGKLSATKWALIATGGAAAVTTGVVVNNLRDESVSPQ
jgi:hypothetical protein